jgi:hypothetical protein
MWLLGCSLAGAQTAVTVPQHESLSTRVASLERRVASVQTAGVGLFLFGAFCALWAQNTGRNAWLWFFVGFLFSCIAVLVLLYKNSEDKRPPSEPRATPLTDRFRGTGG